MELSIIGKYKLLTARLTGELDHHSVKYIRENIDRELIRKGVRNLAMDFSEVSFMDSSGLGVVMGRYKKVASLGGRLILCGMSENIERMFRMCGMDKILIISNSVEEGLEALNV